MNVALPTLARAFGITAGHASAVIVAYLVMSTVGLLIAGPLGDRFGRRRVLLAGLALFIAASAFGALAPGLPLLIAARAFQGLGGAALAAMSIALVLDAFPPAQAGATLGVLGTTSAFATMLGPSLGGIMVSTLGWRSLLAVNVPLEAVIPFVKVADAATMPREPVMVPVARNGPSMVTLERCVVARVIVWIWACVGISVGFG